MKIHDYLEELKKIIHPIELDDINTKARKMKLQKIGGNDESHTS